MALKRITTLGRMKSWAEKQKRCTPKANVLELIDKEIKSCGGNEHSVVLRLTGKRADKAIKLINEGKL